MIKQLTRITLLLSFFLLNACGNSAPSSAPANFQVTPGENSVTITWDQKPGINYYVFAAPGATATRDSVANTPGSSIQPNANSPFVVSGLTNGQIYSFFMNAANGGSEGGPVTATKTATPLQAGQTWTAAVSNTGSAYTNGPFGGDTLFTTTSLAFLNNIYVAVGCEGTLNSTCTGSSIFTSPGGVGVDFARIPTNTTTYTGNKQLNDVIAVNQTITTTATVVVPVYVAVGNGGTIVSSNDAVTWTTQTSAPAITANLNSVTSNGTTFVAVGANGTVVTSADGVTWTTQTPVGLGTANLNSIIYVGSIFYAVGDAGTIFVSVDAVNWSQVAAANFFDAGTSAVKAITANLHDISYGLGAFVAVGDSGTILYSTDGANWYYQDSVLTSANLYSANFISQFVITGAGGTILYGAPASTPSGPQPYTWTTATSSTTNDLYAVITAYDRFLAAGAPKTLVTAY